VRQHRKQPLGELNRRRVRAVGEHDVLQPAGLCAQRFVQARVRVAVDVHPPRRRAVEELAAVLGVEKDALTFHNRQRIGAVEHLGVGMPHRSRVASDEALPRPIGHRHSSTR
jgi:hypothetical protein